MRLYQELALELKVPKYVITSYEQKYTAIEEIYLRLIFWFLRNEHEPTWKIIIAALRSSNVNLRELAGKIEAKYCPPSLTATDGASKTHPCKLQVMIDS